MLAGCHLHRHTSCTPQSRFILWPGKRLRDACTRIAAPRLLRHRRNILLHRITRMPGSWAPPPAAVTLQHEAPSLREQTVVVLAITASITTPRQGLLQWGQIEGHGQRCRSLQTVLGDCTHTATPHPEARHPAQHPHYQVMVMDRTKKAHTGVQPPKMHVWASNEVQVTPCPHCPEAPSTGSLSGSPPARALSGATAATG